MDRIDPSRMAHADSTVNDRAFQPYPTAALTAGMDCIIVIIAANLGYEMRFETWDMPNSHIVAGGAIAALHCLAQALCGTYAPWRAMALGGRMLRLFGGWVLTAGAITLIAYGLKLSGEYSRLWFVYTVALGVLGTSLLRLGIALTRHSLHVRGLNFKNIILIESASTPDCMQDHMSQLASQGYRVSARIALNDNPAWFDTLAPQVAAHPAHEIWLCLPLTEGGLIQPIIHALRHHTAEIRYLPQIDDFPLLNYRSRTLVGMYAIDISCSPMNDASRAIKRLEDLVLGALISLLILPVCILIAAAIRVSSQGPVIFRQDRTGMNGQPFKVYKFRTMAMHQESNGQVTQAAQGDPRITRLGAFLRRTSLDELPQFYNVLKGDMSIVGPRPHALAHNEHYKDQVQFYMKRHKVKPGITGWAQVNGHRGATDTLDKMQARVEHDLWYIRNWSLMLDLRIIGWTIFRGFLNQQP